MSNEGGSTSPWGLLAAVTLGGAAIVYFSSATPALLQTTGFLSFLETNNDPTRLHPVAELLKLIVAALVGIGVTTVHRHYHRDKPMTRSLLQAQVLLCLAGAMVMLIIGNSVARAFGVAGAAGIVRFRTPVEDPKDTTILFLLVTLGMACGIGQLEVAAIGALFLCFMLAVLDRFGETKARLMMLSLVANGKDFPTEHVNRVLRASVDHYEPREMVHGPDVAMKYVVTFGATAPLAWLTQELTANGTAGLKSVSWTEMPKKG